MRIVVIGAGLLGITSAYFLSQSDNEIIVIDRRDGTALETSFANGGMLTPSQAEPWNSPGIIGKIIKWIGREDSPFLLRPGALFSLLGWGALFIRHASSANFRKNLLKNAELACYSMDILKELKRDSGITFDNSERGTMKLYRNRHAFNQAIALSDSIHQAGIHFQRLDADGVIGKEPALTAIYHTIAGGVFYPDDEAGDAYQFCREISRLARDNGVRFMYGTSVNKLVAESNRIKAIDSTAGLVKADVYILSAGSYSPLLSDQIGLSLPIRPVKGYSLTFTPQEWQVLPRIPVVDETRHIAVTPLGSRIRIAGTAELTGYDVSVNDNRIRNIFRLFREIYPESIGSIDYNSVDKWSGLRPYSADGVPILGTCRFENLILNTGHGHLGWTMAAGSGKLIADLIVSGATAIALAPYQLDRFY